MSDTLTLHAFPTSIGGNRVPGMPSAIVGFITSDQTQDAPAGDAALEAWMAAGPAPICLNFGSMDIWRSDSCPWSEELLQAIRASGYRCLAVGEKVPAEVRTWAHHADLVDHASVLPKCALVVHHGGAGTTAACIRAGVPSLVIPVLTWADQPMWAAWLQEQGAGVHVDRPDNGLRGPLERALNPRLREGVLRLRETLEREDGAANAIREYEAYFTRAEPWRRRARETLLRNRGISMSEARRLWHGTLTLMHEPGEAVETSAALRELMFRSVDGATREYPVYKADWPRRHEEVDLERDDLPHASSLSEWWYYHTHLRSLDGTREFSVFAAMFSRAFEDHVIHHAHASALDVGKERHHVRSIGDRRGPSLLADALKRAHRTDFIKCAFRETFAKDEFPVPDRKAATAFDVPTDRMDYRLDAMTIRKDETGDYLVELAPEDGFGFQLRFHGLKRPILNGTHGVVFGPTNDDNMYYYSITRMEVTGRLMVDGEWVGVQGTGWYDHEFGGNRTQRHAAWIQANQYEWSWIGIQFDDQTEIVFATLVDRNRADALHENEILFIDADGTRTYHTGPLDVTRTWTSMRSFIEYDTAWRLRVPDLDIDVTLEADSERQEFISLIANPAYWEGRVRVRGTRAGRAISGSGFVEQYGRGGDRSAFREFLDSVSKEVQRSVRQTAPYDMSYERLRDLVADEEFEDLMIGVDRHTFLDQVVRPVRTIIDRGGKGWRSMSFMLCTDAVGGDPQEVRDFISFPEFLHTGSLIIDDIQDNSDVRRGGPSAHVMFGVPVAINAGTASYFLGERLFRDLEGRYGDEAKLRVYKLYFTCMRGAHTGQAMDINGLHHLVPECMERGDFAPMWSYLMAVHRLKSGLPAMMAARVGVVLGRGTLRQETVLGDYFLSLGQAFQIMDDVINLQGFRNGLKKQAEDLEEGKLTAPVIRAFSVLDDASRRDMWNALRAPRGQRDVPKVMEYLDRVDAIGWCQQHARGLVEEAWAKVEPELVDSYPKAVLRAFGWFVVEIRDY